MSGGKARRRKQKKWLKTAKLRFPNSVITHICRNCGEPGPHFVPPGFGSPGMYMCEAKSGSS